MVRLVLAVFVIFLLGLVMLPAFADAGTISVVSGKTFQVSYNTNGVKILGIDTNPTYDELKVSVQVSSPNASLELTIPRDLLDSKQGSSDIPFITVVDGTLVNVSETNPTSTTRTISIPLSMENQQIEIIGTFVAVSGPNGVTAPPVNVPASPTQTAPPLPSSPHTVPPPVETPPTQQPAPQPTTQPASPTGSVPENATGIASMPQNFSFTIPYVKNLGISLDYVDLAVIGAIGIVVIIVIASATRKRPARVARKNF